MIKKKIVFVITAMFTLGLLFFGCNNPASNGGAENEAPGNSTGNNEPVIPAPEKDDWDVVIPLSLGEKDGVAYVNTETGKFGFYTKSSARYVASGDLVSSGDYVYVEDASDADNSSAFFTVTTVGETTLAKPEVYNTPVDTSKTTEATELNVAMESTKETIDFVKNAGKATYYELEVKEVEGKDGLTISVKDAPQIMAIQYFIRNKTTGKVYTTYLGNGNVPVSYYFPFVNAGEEYQCYVAMTDAVNNTIMYNSKVVAYKTETGKGEFEIDKKMNASDIEVTGGILKVKNLTFPTAVTGATDAHLLLTLNRGTDYNDKDYKWADHRAIYDDGISTYEWDYNKRMSSTNLKEIANKDCFITMTYEFELDGSKYSFTSINNDYVFKFVYDASKLVAEYDAIPDEKGVKFIFNKKGNAEVTYFYVRGPNDGIEIESADISKIAKNAQGGIEVIYPFATADLEQTFTIYAQWSDGSALWKMPTKTAFGGWKTADEILNKDVWLKDTTITLSEGTKDGNERFIKASCASGIEGIAKDSSVKNPSISASVWGRRDGDSWFEEAGNYKIIAGDLTALYNGGLSIFTEGFCTKLKMNSVATYKGAVNNNKYSYRFIARYNFEIDDAEFTAAYGNYEGMAFNMPEKNGEFEYAPVEFAPISTGTVWTGSAKGNWDTPSVMIPADCFIDEENEKALSTSQSLKIYFDCDIQNNGWWEKVYVRSGSRVKWNNGTGIALESDNPATLEFANDTNFVDSSTTQKNWYIVVPLTDEDDIVSDIAANGLELWSCNGTATTFTKVEVVN